MSSVVNVRNKSSKDIGDLKVLDKALHQYVKLIAKAHGVYVWAIVSDALDTGFTIDIVDTLDVADALGYHDLSPEGTPYALIGLDMTEQQGFTLSSVISHELAEMIGDPLCNKWADDGNGNLYAYELCDAVEQYYFDCNGVQVSDFLLPSFFSAFGQRPYDIMGVLHSPFQTAQGGYQIAQRGGTVGQIFGDSLNPVRKEAKQNRRRFERAVKRGIRAAS